LLFVVLICLQGCIDKNVDSRDVSSSIEPEPSYYQVLEAEMDFNSEVGSTLFRASGDLTLWGNSNLPYVVLNATLCRDGQPVTSARYMLIDVQSNRDYGFEICKNLPLPSGEYFCLLELTGPGGLLSSQSRSCRATGFQEDLPPTVTIESTRRAFPASSPSPVSLSVYEKAFQDYAEQERLSEEREASRSASLKIEQLLEEETGLEEVSPSESLSDGAGIEDDFQVIEDDVQDDLPAASNQDPKSSEDAEHSTSQLVGSTSSSKYHRPDCRYAAKIKPENRIYFGSAEEAERKGYEACKSCSPS
jgi:hypothetical protein